MVGHSRAAGLRRAIGLILVAGLCVSAVTFYRDAELPRSAPAMAGGPPSPTASTPTAARLQPRRRRRPHRSPLALRLPRSKMKLPKGPGTTEPGILLMASPLARRQLRRRRDRAARHSDLFNLARSTQAGAGRQPLLQGQAGCLSGPGERREPAGLGAWWSCQPAHDLALGAPAKRIELRYNLSGNHRTQHPLARRPCADCYQSLGRRCPQDSPGCNAGSVAAPCSISSVPSLRLREQACSAGRPPICGSIETAMARRSDRRPVRPAETAMRLAAHQ